MASLEGCDDTWILSGYVGCCGLMSLGGGALSPTLHVWVATWTSSMPIIPINSVGKEPPCITYVDEETMVLTWFTLVSYPGKIFWYTFESLLSWAWGAPMDMWPSSINLQIISLKCWHLLVTYPLWWWRTTWPIAIFFLSFFLIFISPS